MRYVIDVVTIKEVGFHEVRGIGPLWIGQTGLYALTRAELVGPFEDAQEARRIGSIVARRHLKPSREPPPPFKMWKRVVEI